jgi:hypothetical protein
VEVYAGDTSNFAPEAEKATKAAREHEALKRLSKEYTMFPWIIETITAYEQKDSAEACFVKSVDKPVILLFDYVEKGLFYQEHKLTAQERQHKMQKYRENASKHPGTFKYYNELWELLLANPAFFSPEKT